MNTTVAPVAHTAGVQPLNVVGEEMRPLVRGAAFEIIDVRGPRETGPPPHHHPWDEAYILLEGELLVQRGDEVVILQPGDCVHIPANTLHRYEVKSETAHFYTITSPASAADFFEDVSRSVPSADDMPALVAAARRHRVESPLFPV